MQISTGLRAPEGNNSESERSQGKIVIKVDLMSPAHPLIIVWEVNALG
jgi:hypothetical protein